MAVKRDKKGRFIKGVVQNPKGRPVGSKNVITRDIKEALAKVEDEQGVSMVEMLFRKAFTDPKIALKMMNYIHPTLSSVKSELNAIVDGKVEVSTSLELSETLLQGLPKPPDEE